MGKVGGTSEHDAMIARGNAVIAAEKAKLLTWEQSVALNKAQANALNAQYDAVLRKQGRI